MIPSFDTSKMTEFEKFSFFANKKAEADEFRGLFFGLLPALTFGLLAKKLRISQKALSSYIFYREPLPDGLLWRFKTKFKDEIADAKHKRDLASLEAYFNIGRTTPSRLEDNSADKATGNRKDAA